MIIFLFAAMNYMKLHDIDTEQDVATQLSGAQSALGDIWTHVRETVDKNIEDVLEEGASK